MEIAKVDEESNHAMATILHLPTKHWHYDLLSQFNLAHDILNRLPVELKNRIFEILLPPRDQWGEIPPFQKTTMPSYLASICRGWRDVAWSNPFLWSTIHLVIRETGPSHVHDWIQRSQNLLLTLHIRAESSKVSTDALLDIMIQCSNKLQSLSLDVPLHLLCAFQHINFPCLTQLRLVDSWGVRPDQPLSLSASPEMVDLYRLSPTSLKIPWNRLSCATVRHFDLEDITHLFQHASQMTECHILWPYDAQNGFSMSPMTHHGLKTLTIRDAAHYNLEPRLLGSLTLPSLQEVHIDDPTVLRYLAALVLRSSCPLTALSLLFFQYQFDFNKLQSLPGVTDLLVVETLNEYHYAIGMQKLLLEEYFPDLRHLTLRLPPFLILWRIGAIPLLLDWKRGRSHLPKIFVVDQGSKFDSMWNSNVGEQLKALNISPREDGFEFL